jgi:hypothetical protein
MSASRVTIFFFLNKVFSLWLQCKRQRHYTTFGLAGNRYI